MGAIESSKAVCRKIPSYTVWHKLGRMFDSLQTGEATWEVGNSVQHKVSQRLAFPALFELMDCMAGHPQRGLEEETKMETPTLRSELSKWWS